MRLRNIKNADEIIKSSKHIVLEPTKYKGLWHNLFNNNNLIYTEIGMGRGKFIVENAMKYPNINFIGIEKFSSVMARAIQRMGDIDLPNLKLICLDALNITEVFDHEIDLIYLNFSDPWPKERHARRRLTSDIFLDLYPNILKGDIKIIQKTDNVKLFNYSVEQYNNHNYIINITQFDINNIPEDNIMTEYETRFINNNNIIYKIEVLGKK